MVGEDVDLREVWFEFYRIGKVVKVSAIDPDTGTEVSIVGPPNYGEETLKRTAIQKLKYVISKNRAKNRAENP